MTVSRMIDSARARGFTMGKKLLITMGGVLYLLSPIDLVPELVPVLGVVDDLGMLVLLFKVWTSPTITRASQSAGRSAAPSSAIAPSSGGQPCGL